MASFGLAEAARLKRDFKTAEANFAKAVALYVHVPAASSSNKQHSGTTPLHCPLGSGRRVIGRGQELSQEQQQIQSMARASYKILCQLMIVHGRVEEAAKTGRVGLRLFPADEKLAVVWATAAIKSLPKLKRKARMRKAMKSIKLLRRALSASPASANLRGILTEMTKLSA